MQIKLAASLMFCSVMMAASGPAAPAPGSGNGIVYGIKTVNQRLIVRWLDLGSLQPAQDGYVLSRQSERRLNAIFQSSDRSIGVLQTATPMDSTGRALWRTVGIPGHLTDVGDLSVSGLSPHEALTSVAVPSPGAAIGLVAHYSDTPPFSLAILSLRSDGVAVTSRWALDAQKRYGHLTLCPDGSIFATELEREEPLRLVQLHVANRTFKPLAELKLGDKELEGDVKDLACSPTGQLYALADLNYSGVNSIFSIDPKRGAMTFVQKFDVDRMTFVH